MSEDTCGSCEHYLSYACIYEDDLEPYDVGECHKGAYPYPTDQCGICEDDEKCNDWEPGR